jgi:FkbM family methyltransferase
MASSIKQFAGRPKRYSQRIFRWLLLITQVRGTRLSDKISLVTSALLSIFTSLYRLDDWQDPVLLRDSLVDVKGVGSFSLKARTDELYHVCPFRESYVISAISKYLRNGEVFIDAGANIGFYSVLASRIVGSSGSVIAIEMIDSTASSLKRNTELNHASNIRIVQAAITSKTDPNIRAFYRTGSLGQASLIYGDIVEGEAHQSESVRTISLSEILKEFQQISILKMDLEGSELDALLSAGQNLEKVNSIIFELLDSSDNTLCSFLVGHGYLLERLDGRNILARRLLLN